MIQRSAFPWNRKPHPQIQTIAVRLEQQPIPIPGPQFYVAKPGDSFCFLYPGDGQTYALTVQEYERHEVPQNSFSQEPGWEFPTHLIAMSYTIVPELPDVVIVQDCAEGDRPRRKPRELQEPTAENDILCAGIFGIKSPLCEGTASQEAQNKIRIACSSLHFEPVEDVEWRIIFREKQFENVTIALV